MLLLFELVLVVSAILGYVLTIKKHVSGFIIWCFGNIGFALLNYIHYKSYGQGTLFVIYTFMTIWGILEWKKEK